MQNDLESNQMRSILQVKLNEHVFLCKSRIMRHNCDKIEISLVKLKVIGFCDVYIQFHFYLCLFTCIPNSITNIYRYFQFVSPTHNQQFYGHVIQNKTKQKLIDDIIIDMNTSFECYL